MNIFLVLTLFIFKSFAYDCPSLLSTNEKSQQAYDWLQKFAGTYTFGNCHIEMIACEKSQTINESAPIGEILIQMTDGREAYLSVDFPQVEEAHFQTKVITSKRAFYFRKRDRFYEKENGRTEIWQLELDTLWEDTEQLKGITVGIYTTHSQLHQPNGNDSHWFKCENN